MFRYSIKSLLAAILLAAVLAWWIGSGPNVIFRDESPQHGSIRVFAVPPDHRHDGDRIRIKFVPPRGNSATVHWSGTMVLGAGAATELEFGSVVDPGTGIWCIFDTTQRGVVILILPGNRNGTSARGFGTIWHPGVHIGWGRGLWAQHFDRIKASNPGIPYERLPGELRLDTE